MKSLLFSPLTVKNICLKNRIVMSPMAMHSASNTGEVTDWLKIHYASRALGQVGLIMLESMAISLEGKVSDHGNLGIWDDVHINGLKELTDLLHSLGSQVAAQLYHAGRKSEVSTITPVAPSSLTYQANNVMPKELTKNDILQIIDDFKQATIRCQKAAIDIIELHAAHGYLINQFLSPLANHRTDEYGGTLENRYRLLGEIIEEIKAIWHNPLFVRISSVDHAKGGTTLTDSLFYATKMKEQGVDLIDCSSGGVVPIKINYYPNYQVPAAEQIRNQVGIITGAVGLIKTASQAEEILRNSRADLIFIGRALLRDPFWARSAAEELAVDIPIPIQYSRYGSNWLQR